MTIIRDFTDAIRDAIHDLDRDMNSDEVEFRQGIHDESDYTERDARYNEARLAIGAAIRDLADELANLERLRNHTCDYGDKDYCYFCGRPKLS